MNNAEIKNKTFAGMIWKFSENFGAQLAGFVLQIFMARILVPEDYGVIAISTVFISIANIIITTLFSSAIIQKKEVSEREKSSVFWAGLLVSFLLFGIIFAASPFISIYYNEELLLWVLRIQSLGLIFESTILIHNAIIARSLQFKKSFKARLIAIFVQGAVGLVLAYKGFGVWALVFSTLSNYVVASIVIWIAVKWKPKLAFSLADLKSLFSFSSKVFFSALTNTIFRNIKALIIGKKFDSTVLGYYNRGNRFPSLIMTNTDGAINAVMFPVLSKFQDDKENFLKAFRRSIKTSTYVVFPLMFGLAAIAKSFTLVVLTEKWLPIVPFMQIMCLECLFWPFSIRIHAYNAIGKSGISLKYTMVSNAIALAIILATIPFGVYAIAISTSIASVITFSIGTILMKKIFNYKMKQQLLDVLPHFILSAIMGVAVMSIQYSGLPMLIVLIVEFLLGIIIYLGGSVLFKMDSLNYLINILKNKLKNG